MDFASCHFDRCSSAGLAARVGDVEMLKTLLDQDSPLDVADNRGWIPLHEAAFGNHFEVLNVLMLKKEQFDVNFRAHDGTTPLLIAAQNGYVECCRILLINGADPNLGSLDASRPIIEATRKNKLDCVTLLIEYGADVNVTYWNGWSALHEAAQNGHKDILNYLLSKKADVFCKDDDGLTPVFVACQYGKANCLRLLLENCTDTKTLVDSPTNDGATCVYITSQEGYEDCLEVLLQWKADVNLLTEESIHPLVPAAKFGRTKCMHLLLPLVDLSIVKHSTDPVFFAVEENQLDAVKLLIEHRFPVDRASEFYQLSSAYTYLMPVFSKTFATPLGLAVFKNRTEMVKLLLDRGVRMTIENCSICNPLILAIMRDISYLEMFLRQNVVLNGISEVSAYAIPDTVLLCQHPVFREKFLLMLKCGLKPMLKNWCGCRTKVNESFIKEIRRVFVTKDIRSTLKLVILFESGIPNCCNVYEQFFGDEWVNFQRCATSPASLQHLCRLAVRETMSTKVLFEQNFVKDLHLPNILSDYLAYADLQI